MERPVLNIEDKNWMVNSIQKTVNGLGTSLDLICMRVEKEGNIVGVGSRIKIGDLELQIVSINTIFKGEHLDPESLGVLALPPNEVKAWKKRVDRS